MACNSSMSNGCSIAVLVIFITAVVAAAAGAVMQIVGSAQGGPKFVAENYGWAYVAALVLGIAAMITSFSCQYARCNSSDCTCGKSEEEE